VPGYVIVKAKSERGRGKRRGGMVEV